MGFVIAYAGVGGPRVVGAANGLQLLYILPSFPPYQPDALGSRLIGLVLAVGLLMIADRVLWPPPVPTPFRHRLAAAIHAVRDRLVALRESDGDGRAPAESDVQGAIARPLSSIPPLERPTGPGRRDRAAMQAATLVRGMEARVAALAELTERIHPAAAHLATAKLLGVTAASLDESAEALGGHGPDPDPAPVEDALSDYLRQRESLGRSPEIDHGLRIRLRFAVAAEELSVWTRDLAVAVRIMQGRRVPDSSATSIAEPFWYANRSTQALWFMRFRGHFTPRSVFFQNAIRLAVGLAAARLVAGELDLSHGFWMLLATLTLMRTSVATTRAAVVPAFLGTIAGLIAALVLALAGADSTVYEVAFPFVMVLALAAGPLIGPVAGQAMFTLLVAMLFAQMAPVSWRLAEVRILDVVLGGLLGAVVGLLVWPRGATGEMRRTAEATLKAAANDLESTVGFLTHREVAAAGQRDTAAVAVRFLMLADSTLAQYRSELRSTSDHVDWLDVIGLAQEAVRGGQALRRTHRTAGPLRWPRVAADLQRLGAGTAEQLREIADLVSTRMASAPLRRRRCRLMGGCQQARGERLPVVRSTQPAQSESSISGDGLPACLSIAGEWRPASPQDPRVRTVLDFHLPGARLRRQRRTRSGWSVCPLPVSSGARRWPRWTPTGRAAAAHWLVPSAPAAGPACRAYTSLRVAKSATSE